jgi:hypothetical protein
MGSLQYDGDRIEFDDRLLAHLQIVMVQRLRSGDSFIMSWMNALSIGDGRSSIWVDRTIPLRFNFAGSRPPAINREWLAALERTVSSSTGLIVLGEDGKLARCGSAR